MNQDAQTDRSGILAAGNWVVDHVKTIDHYPAEDTVTNILEERLANGGGPYNLLKDLSRMGAKFPLAGTGAVGDDTDGEFILKDCRTSGIDVEGLTAIATESTGYTDVMSVQSTGRRTFFYKMGANRLLDTHHFKIGRSAARIFYVGYLNLLPRLSQKRVGGRSGTEWILSEATAAGMKTAVDLVTLESSDLRAVAEPSLPYIDTLFANEWESQWLTGLPVAEMIAKDSTVAEDAASAVLALGVQETVVIHFPGGAVAVTAGGERFAQGSVRVPEQDIVGMVGAGDALAAGVLYGLHEGWKMPDCLELGVCVAAACLYDQTTSYGVRPVADCLELGSRYGYREM